MKTNLLTRKPTLRSVFAVLMTYVGWGLQVVGFVAVMDYQTNHYPEVSWWFGMVFQWVIGAAAVWFLVVVPFREGFRSAGQREP